MNKETKVLSAITEYKSFSAKYHDVLNSVSKYKNEIMDKALSGDISEKEFFDTTSILSSQSRSPLWEKYMIKKLGATKTPSTSGRGDFNYKGSDYEYKISGYNLGYLLHAVQIRMWQNCDYMITYVSPNTDPIHFVLDHEEMKSELKLLKASSAHGTKEANKGNANIEYRFTIAPDSNDFVRWIKMYTNKKG